MRHLPCDFLNGPIRDPKVFWMIFVLWAESIDFSRQLELGLICLPKIWKEPHGHWSVEQVCDAWLYNVLLDKWWGKWERLAAIWKGS